MICVITEYLILILVTQILVNSVVRPSLYFVRQKKCIGQFKSDLVCISIMHNMHTTSSLVRLLLLVLHTS